MKRAAITGATGAIGTALIDTLIKNDVDVLVITRADSKRNDRIPKIDKVKVLYADLSDLAGVDISGEDKCDVFYHLAWAGASGSARNDMYLQTKNIEYALDAVKLAKRLRCETFVGAGSQAEYGLSNEKLTADTPTRPFMGYGFAKLCAGQMTRELAHQEGMKHVWTRILSVYGPNDGENSMVSSLIRDLRAGITPKMTAGTQVWDYLYSYDAADALFALGDKGQDGKVYVLGSGKARPLKEYVEVIKNMVTPQTRVNYGAVPFSANQVMYLCADLTDIINDTGWKPKYSFHEGMIRLMEDKLI